MKSKYDMVRGLMAIIVLIAHVNQVFWLRLYGLGLFQQIISMLAYHAVLIFFLLSGYLITLSIINNIQRNNKYFNFKDYFLSRFLRIYPPFVGSLVIAVIIWKLIYIFNLPGKDSYGLPLDLYIVREKYDLGWRGILQALIFEPGQILQVNGPLWSLFIEIKIYILAAIISLVIAGKSTKIKLLSLIIFIYLMISFSKDQTFLFFLVIWLIGSATALYEKQIKTNIIGAFSCVSIIILGAQNYTLLTTLDNTIPSQFMQILFSIFYSYLIFCSSILNKIYPKKILETAKFSYSLYIIHFPLLLFSLSLTQNWISYSYFKTLIVSIFSIVIIMMISYLFSLYFENKNHFKTLFKINVL